MIKLPIFRYHHVSKSIDPSSVKGMQVRTEDFDRQMYLLSRNGFRCLSLADAMDNWQKGVPQPDRSFVLTFDDGYIDNFENASSILKKFKFAATIFVTVKPVEDGVNDYLSWQTMRELSRESFSFGSHTLTHPKLSSLDSSTIIRELDESKKIIEDRLGLAVDMLAYPYGDSDERVQKIARETGYRAACGMTWGQVGSFNLWRVPIYEYESEPAFCLKAFGMYYPYTWLREYAHKLRK